MKAWLRQPLLGGRLQKKKRALAQQGILLGSKTGELGRQIAAKQQGVLPRDICDLGQETPGVAGSENSVATL